MTLMGLILATLTRAFAERCGWFRVGGLGGREPPLRSDAEFTSGVRVLKTAIAASPGRNGDGWAGPEPAERHSGAALPVTHVARQAVARMQAVARPHHLVRARPWARSRPRRCEMEQRVALQMGRWARAASGMVERVTSRSRGERRGPGPPGAWPGRCAQDVDAVDSSAGWRPREPRPAALARSGRPASRAGGGAAFGVVETGRIEGQRPGSPLPPPPARRGRPRRPRRPGRTGEAAGAMASSSKPGAATELDTPVDQGLRPRRPLRVRPAMNHSPEPCCPPPGVRAPGPRTFGSTRRGRAASPASPSPARLPLEAAQVVELGAPHLRCSTTSIFSMVLACRGKMRSTPVRRRPCARSSGPGSAPRRPITMPRRPGRARARSPWACP
jgi:hypothetical protein